ncbi:MULTISPECIES: MAPEG family protein [unclassified Brevundimonas]|uniref:MAPEG family protein n=1 Tax=unclassified Brevundimonas TaxID=2622653 RepID=UPI003F93CCFE
MVPSIQAAALWGGLLILTLLVLSSVVVGRRRRFMIEFGDGGNPEMTPAVRAFGNAAEYVPAGICGLILLAFVGAPPLLIHGVGGVLFLGRVIHGLGLLFQKGPSLGRVTGMVLTWLALLIAAVSLIAWSVI